MGFGFDHWQSYTWKNELVLQSDRAIVHFKELLSDTFEGDYMPFHMFERALVLSGFIVRRLIETKQVTDRLSKSKTQVRSFIRSSSGSFKRPFHYATGGDIYRNYDIEKEVMVGIGYGDLANEIIHAAQIVVAHDEQTVPDGLLIASDWRLKDRILHMTIDEFQSFVRAVLDDRVTHFADGIDEAGKIYATRD